MRISREDYKQGNFSQSQEEAGGAVTDAITELCSELGLNPDEASKVLKHSMRALDSELQIHLSVRQ